VIKATSEVQAYQTRFTNGQAVSFSDTTGDKGGSGTGFRPHELLEAALATCVNMMVRMHAERLSIPVAGVCTTVTLDRTRPDEVIFDYGIEIEGPVSEADRQRLLETVKSCPVRQTLSKKLTFRG
jgi:putative redox protein